MYGSHVDKVFEGVTTLTVTPSFRTDIGCEGWVKTHRSIGSTIFKGSRDRAGGVVKGRSFNLVVVGVGEELAIGQGLGLRMREQRRDNNDQKSGDGQHGPYAARVGFTLFHKGILGFGLFACGLGIRHTSMLGAGRNTLVIALGR